MSDDEHEQLLQALLDRKGMVMISGYDNEIYYDYPAEWTEVLLRTAAERGWLEHK